MRYNIRDEKGRFVKKETKVMEETKVMKEEPVFTLKEFKPFEGNYPEWADYAAINNEGLVIYFSNRPNRTDKGWKTVIGKSRTCGVVSPIKDWRESLRRNPDACKYKIAFFNDHYHFIERNKAQIRNFALEDDHSDISYMDLCVEPISKRSFTNLIGSYIDVPELGKLYVQSVYRDENEAYADEGYISDCVDSDGVHYSITPVSLMRLVARKEGVPLFNIYVYDDSTPVYIAFKNK